jgi:hypothetical protein
MTIHTTYFAKAGQLPSHIAPVAICLKPPYWFKCPNYKPLAPSLQIFQLPPEEYTAAFQKYLRRLDPRKTVSDLEALANGSDIALCCFEKVGDFCHRHIVAAWLSEWLGETVEEYVYPPEPPVSETLSMF